MRILILAAGAALALSACSKGSSNDQANADMNAAAADNMAVDQNMTTDMNATMNGPGGADANVATNAAEENGLKQKDMNTNDRDTNLSNGI